MPRPRSIVPTYRLHKQSGQAVMTVSGTNGRKDLTLGRYGSPESKAEYRRVLAILDANGGRMPSGCDERTVCEVLLAYFQHALRHYRDADGNPTSELDNVRLAIQPVRELFGHVPVSEFGPLALKTVRDRMMKPTERTIGKRKVITKLSRKVINKRVGHIRRAFKWAVSEELVPGSILHALQSVTGLQRGRTDAGEREPVKPAVMVDVQAALPYMSPTVAAIVRLQLLTGARCGELLVMKPADIDRTGDVWQFVPMAHKGSWRGTSRAIMFGPEAQRLLASYLLRAGDGYVFSPVRTVDERNADRSAERVTPKWESHMRRNESKRKAAPKWTPGERYTTASLRRAVKRACNRAGVPPFSPHRLRHLAAHIIRDEFGLEYCRATLGHRVASMSEHYSRETDGKLAAAVALKIG